MTTFFFLSLSCLVLFATTIIIKSSNVTTKNIQEFSDQNSSVFNWTIGNTSVWLSAAAYCNTDTYLNRTYTGYSAGFVPMYVINVPEFDVQVFIIKINSIIYV